MEVYAFSIVFRRRKVRTHLKVAVIAASFDEAKEALLKAYPTSSLIAQEYQFDEIIYPEDWPDEREGKPVDQARRLKSRRRRPFFLGYPKKHH